MISPRATFAALLALSLLGCVREARIHISAAEIAAGNDRSAYVSTTEAEFTGTRMQIVAVENDDGTRTPFRPHVGLNAALRSASPRGTTLVVRQTDYTSTSNVGQTLTLVSLVIVGGVSQVLGIGAIVTTRDVIKRPFDQRWYFTTFAFGVGVLIAGASGALFWLTSRIAFLRHTNLGEGRLR